jgi:hypothetical protein
MFQTLGVIGESVTFQGMLKLPTKVIYFQNFFYQIKFLDPVLNDDAVSVTQKYATPSF